MKLESIHLENHCYVLLQGNWMHPIAHRRHDLIWYPERAMTLLERHTYRPYVKSIVTEDAWLIGCYPRDRVSVVSDDGSWQPADEQTYGASHSNITSFILGIRGTIPAMVMDGGESIQDYIKEYKKYIDKATKLYKV